MKFLYTADWHLRKSVPVCRLDEDWVQTLQGKIEQVCALAKKYNVPIFNGGDLCHTWRVPPEIELLVKDVKDMHILTGNHDVEHHREENLGRSSLGVMLQFPGIQPLEATDEILFLHTLVFPDKKAQPQIKGKTIGTTARELLKQYPDYDWICTGDYHRNFHYEKNGRHVINPGCLTRQAADFADYQPGVYLVDTESAEPVKWIPLQAEDAVITDAHLKKEQARNERMDAFVENLASKDGVSFDFESNLENKRLQLQAGDLNHTILT